jgi:hypothetical protein
MDLLAVPHATFFEFWEAIDAPVSKPYRLASVQAGMVVREFYTHLELILPPLLDSSAVGVELRDRDVGRAPGYDIYVDRRRFCTGAEFYDLLLSLSEFFTRCALPLELRMPPRYGPIDNIPLDRQYFRALPIVASDAQAPPRAYMLAEIVERAYVANRLVSAQFLGIHTERRIVDEEIAPTELRDAAAWITPEGRAFHEEVVSAHLATSMAASLPPVPHPTRAPHDPISALLARDFLPVPAPHAAHADAGRWRSPTRRVAAPDETPAGALSRAFLADFGAPAAWTPSPPVKKDWEIVCDIAAYLRGGPVPVHAPVAADRNADGIPLAWLEEDEKARAALSTRVSEAPRLAGGAHPTTQTAAWTAFVPLHPIDLRDRRCARCASRPALTVARPCGHTGYCGTCYQDALGTVYERNCRVCLQHIDAVVHEIVDSEAPVAGDDFMDLVRSAFDDDEADLDNAMDES